MTKRESRVPVIFSSEPSNGQSSRHAICGTDVTGGVGERVGGVRGAVCAKVGFHGLKVDGAANANPVLDADIATPDSAVRVLVIRAQEDWAIANECWRRQSDQQV